jgi:hypothetical protein
MSVPEDALHQKLHPARFPNMSLQMAAILGFVLERDYTRPVLAEIVVTPDGHVLARPAGEVGPMAYLAAEADLRANLRRLGMAAGLMMPSGRTMRHGFVSDLGWSWAGRWLRIVRDFRGKEDRRRSQ